MWRTWLFLNRHHMSLEWIAKSIDIAFLALLDQFFEVGHFITALEKIDMNTRPLLSHLPLSKKSFEGETYLELESSWNEEESILCFFYCIQLGKRWKSSSVDSTTSKGYFFSCIPYGQLTHSGMLRTCLWDIQLNLPKSGQLLQE